MTPKEILDILIIDGDVEMHTEESFLQIRFKKFFTSEKEFLFILNGKGIADFKTKRAALRKIGEFINLGFSLET